MTSKLFDESDFALFTKYQGKNQATAPEAQGPLRELYNKLGKITDELKKRGYHCDIRRDPLIRGMRYEDYHWARIYPMQKDYLSECKDIVFFVISTTESGVNIHIDSYEVKGHKCNEAAERIKSTTWCEYSPKVASGYSCNDFANLVEDYIKKNWKAFNLFGKEFGIAKCINELNRMDFINLLQTNYNLVLTGAPGTGKTYLAKKIAKAIGAEKDSIKMVQFHPSYDYTDFVEGLRPIKEEKNLGFKRKDGVFKAFCRKALITRFHNAYYNLIDDIKTKKVSTVDLKTKESAQLYVTDNGNITWYSENEDGNKSSNVVSLTCLEQLYGVYHSIDELESISNLQDDVRKVLPGCNTSYYWGILHYLLVYINEHKSNPPYVFIIDEINRGEISKIFGELFFSVEPGYRGAEGIVDTQYQNLIPKEGDEDFNSNKADVFRNGFYVPENVYIIGTMNDIDRSVESMDFAMRRRFAWKEIKAKDRLSMLDDDKAWKGNKPDPDTIARIKNRMKNLNDCIIDQYGDEDIRIGLTEEYQIGAAYFLKYGLYDSDQFGNLWNNHLNGVLREYLRGATDIKDKIKKLEAAYNDEKSKDQNEKSGN